MRGFLADACTGADPIPEDKQRDTNGGNINLSDTIYPPLSTCKASHYFYDACSYIWVSRQ